MGGWQSVTLAISPMQKARDRVRDYFSRYVPRYKEHNGCNQPMVYGVVELLSDDPYPSQLASIEAYTRRRLRARIVDQPKNKLNPL